MRRTVLALAVSLVCTSAFAAEVPARYRGVWINGAAQNQQCAATDWKPDGSSENDALARITAEGIREHESECKAQSVKTVAVDAGPNRMTDGPSTVVMACSGEGETWKVRETWSLSRVRNDEVLTAASLDKPAIRTFIRCR